MIKQHKDRTKKYKILLVVRWPVGGIRTFLSYNLKNIEWSKYQFTIIAPECNELSALLDDIKELDIIYKPVKEYPSILEFMFAIVTSITKEKYDLIYSHGFTSGVCSALPAILKRVPHLLTSHDVLLEQQFHGINGKLKKLYLSIILPLAFNCIHSVSNDAQENLLQSIPTLKPFKKHLVVIPNGIDISRFMTNEKTDFRQELQLPNNVFLIGFFGRFMSQKGLIYLIDAIENLTKYHLEKKPLVLCFGDGGFIREDKEYIRFMTTLAG